MDHKHFFDIDGRPITFEEYLEFRESPDYQLLRSVGDETFFTEVLGRVSAHTDWLEKVFSSRVPEDPKIWETWFSVDPPSCDHTQTLIKVSGIGYTWRYRTRTEAVEGHNAAVSVAKAVQSLDGWQLFTKLARELGPAGALQTCVTLEVVGPSQGRFA